MLMSKERYDALNVELDSLREKVVSLTKERDTYKEHLLLKLSKAEDDPQLEKERAVFGDEIEEMVPLLRQLAAGNSVHKHCATLNLSLIATLKEQNELQKEIR